MANYDLGTIGFTVQNTGAEESTADVNLLVKAIERAEKQFDTLQRALNKGKLSQEQYQRGVQQTTQTVERLNRVMQNQGSALDQQTFAFNRAGRGMNEFGFYAQQVGYQVGDFFVQVQSGTSFLVAFGQQATQLAGLIPGVLGAAIGIGISALTAIGSAFFRSTEGAKTFQDSLSSVNDVLSETSNLVKIANGDFSELEEKFGSLAPAIKALAETRAEVSIRQMADAAKELNTQLTDMYSGSAWTNVSRAEDLANAFSLNTMESRNLANAMSELASQDTLGGQVEAATALREMLLKTFGPVREMTSEQFNFYLQVLQTEEAYRELLNRTGEVSGEISLMEGAMALFTSASGAAAVAVNGIETAASSALGVVTNLATKMWEAAQARIAANRELETMKMEFSPAGRALEAYGSRGTVSNRPVTFSDGTVLEKPKPSPARGGLGKSNSVEALVNQLQTERETIDEWYVESQDALRNASESELQIIGGYNEAKLRLEKEYQDRLKGIRDEGHVTALGDAETFFGGMAAIAQAGGDRTVKAMRVFSAAQALINSYVAFTEVLKDPSFIGRPFARFGAAASALSSGLAAVAAIKGGGSGGGSMSRGSATVAASSNSAPAPQTVFIDSISPESLYSGETLINLFEAFYDENDKRGKVFMVAR